MSQMFDAAVARGMEGIENLLLGGSLRFRFGLRCMREASALELGKVRARAAARRAFQRVPAYREFLAENGVFSVNVPFSSLPMTNKDKYVRTYPTEERCVRGSYLSAGVAIDESAGSSGIPYNWVRGPAERRRMQRTIARMVEWTFGDRPRIAINAFSMGAWATGVNMGEALGLHSVVKSTGPDLDKILHTLEFFGPQPGYFICGYPPFLKLVVDTMEQRGFPMNEYEMHGMVGGEGMSEALRQHLLRHLRSCMSGYGASDLEMGVAMETPEAVRVRGIMDDHPKLAARLLDGDHRLPMVFQYNPLTHFIEVGPQGQLVVTLTHSDVLSPRIRYDVGDEGCLWRRSDLRDALREQGHPVDMPTDEALPFPYVFLFGRRDSTISIMGANIYPEDIERAVFAQSQLATGFASYAISVEDHGDGSVRPKLCIEWHTTEPPSFDLKALAADIQRKLAEINSDYRNALQEFSEALQLELQVDGFGCGPFANRDQRIKNRYIRKAS